MISFIGLKKQNADVAELADALVSGSSEAIHVGSSPVIRTKKYCRKHMFSAVFFYPLRKQWHIITL